MSPSVMNLTLQLTNDIAEVPRLASWVEELAETYQLSPDKSFQLNLALEEAVVNVMNYAYPGQQGRPISLTAVPFDDGIRFLLIDEGIPFDPTQQATPDSALLDSEDRPIGGLGILLVREFMSDISYKYEDGRNQLYMTICK